MLRLFEVWPQNEHLSLRHLSFKLASLFCLISCKRVSDVRALDLGASSISPSGVSFVVSKRTMTSIRSVSYPAYPHNTNLCQVTCLKEYKRRTLYLRGSLHSDLFLSLPPPHNLIALTTISRWVRLVLEEAGMDVGIFGAHFTRSAAATSVISVGSQLDDLMRTVDWSCESMFREIYFRTVSNVFSSVFSQL